MDLPIWHILRDAGACPNYLKVIPSIVVLPALVNGPPICRVCRPRQLATPWDRCERCANGGQIDEGDQQERRLSPTTPHGWGESKTALSQMSDSSGAKLL